MTVDLACKYVVGLAPTPNTRTLMMFDSPSVTNFRVLMDSTPCGRCNWGVDAEHRAIYMTAVVLLEAAGIDYATHPLQGDLIHSLITDVLRQLACGKLWILSLTQIQDYVLSKSRPS